LWDSFVSPK
ncbi:PA-X protein, partial [Influenza A virus]